MANGAASSGKPCEKSAGRRSHAKKKNERSIQNEVIEYLSMLPKSFVYECYNGAVPITAKGNKIIYKTKNLKARPNGFPDLIWFFRGRVICLELKTLDGRLSQDQMACHTMLKHCGIDVRVIRGLGGAVELVKELGAVTPPST